MRLGERLKLQWDVDEEVLRLKVPSLLLQPLVENAVRHGIASTTRGGALQICAKWDDGFLHLQVRDSGPGLPAVPASSKEGVGLANTQARLRAIYVDSHIFELINHGGLTVNVRLPIGASRTDGAMDA
jgi:two-component system sensor histidine kinase AlgZ